MSRASVFLMSCGTPEFRFPDDWMTTPAWAREAVTDSHVSKWWSSGFPSLVHAGDIAVLVATKSGKVMGAFEVAGEPIEDRSHPRDSAAPEGDPSVAGSTSACRMTARRCVGARGRGDKRNTSEN